LDDKILDAQKLKNFSILTQDTRGEQDRSERHAVSMGDFSNKEQTSFWNEAYGDILFDVFKAWLNTSHDDSGQREYLFNTAMALGQVREKLAGMSHVSNNIRYANSYKEDEIETDNQEL